MPDMTGQNTEWRFAGQLEFQPIDGPKCTASITYVHGDPTSLAVHLDWTCPHTEVGSFHTTLTHWPRNHLWIRNTDAGSPGIELLGISGHTYSGTRITVKVSAFEIGLTTTPEAADACYLLQVQLQPTGILALPAIHELSFTGEIRITSIEAGAATIATPVGTIEVARAFQFRDGQEHGNGTTIRTERAVVRGEITVRAGSSLSATHALIQNTVSSICQALSLCARQPVEAYEYAYLPDPNVHVMAGRARAVLRRKRPAVLTRRSGNELINMRALREGGIERLLSALAACKPTERVDSMIRMLSSSYTTVPEVGYFMVFAALEAALEICAVPGSRSLAAAGEWNRIEAAVGGAIDGLALGANAESIKRKIPELRRAALFDRVRDCAERLGPRVNDLWPAVGFEPGMRNAIDVRNRLVHGGAIDNDMGRDLVRVRTFVERLLLKRLAWRDEDVWNWYDQDLKWLNSGG